MKKLLFILGLMSSVLVAFGQSKEVKTMLSGIEGQWKLDEIGNITYQRIVEVADMKKEEIYSRALSYFVNNYASGKSVIQTQDKDGGLIVVKGIYSSAYSGPVLFSMFSCSTWHIIRVDVKDGKARITLSLTEYDQKIGGGNSPTSYSTININSVYPIIDKGAFKNSYGKTFYASHKRALATLEVIEKSIKEGNISKEIGKNDW
jgi:hypothetical protein